MKCVISYKNILKELGIYVYKSVAECINRWLDVCGVKNLIINK